MERTGPWGAPVLKHDSIGLRLVRDSETGKVAIQVDFTEQMDNSDMYVMTEIAYLPIDMRPGEPWPIDDLARALAEHLSSLERGLTEWNVIDGSWEAGTASAASNRLRLGIERQGDLEFVADFNHRRGVNLYSK